MAALAPMPAEREHTVIASPLVRRQGSQRDFEIAKK